MGHIHSDSQYDYTASGYIIHDNKILLLLHHTLKLWLPPAGHIELSETPIEGLYREIEEESGLILRSKTMPLLI
ncbi:NUDIX domain-containing protein [Candidatus Saccharibacteria bacterium]|nr:NUDIX domain-containing protein [Candidatus Saccharibacteria bacterium]